MCAAVECHLSVLSYEGAFLIAWKHAFVLSLFKGRGDCSDVEFAA